jgi:glutamyl-tRNA synthetase
MPLLRNVDKSKISKRKNPAARLTWFQEQGYLPEALLNFLGLLGYSLPSRTGGLHLRGDVGLLRLERVNTVGPVFDLDKLGWLNGHYLRELPEDELVRPDDAPPADGRPGRRPRRRRSRRPRWAGAAPLVHTRMAVLSGSARPAALPVRRRGRVHRGPRPAAGEGAHGVVGGRADGRGAGAGALEQWSTETVQGPSTPRCSTGWPQARQGLHAAARGVCGAAIAPPLPESMALLGKERALRRLRAASAQAGGATG